MLMIMMMMMTMIMIIIIIIIMITIIMNIMIILEYFKNQASLVTDFLYSDHTNSINSFPRKNIIPLLKK